MPTPVSGVRQHLIGAWAQKAGAGLGCRGGGWWGKLRSSASATHACVASDCLAAYAAQAFRSVCRCRASHHSSPGETPNARPRWPRPPSYLPAPPNGSAAGPARRSCPPWSSARHLAMPATRAAAPPFGTGPTQPRGQSTAGSGPFSETFEHLVGLRLGAVKPLVHCLHACDKYCLGQLTLFRPDLFDNRVRRAHASPRCGSDAKRTTSPPMCRVRRGIATTSPAQGGAPFRDRQRVRGSPRPPSRHRSGRWRSWHPRRRVGRRWSRARRVGRGGPGASWRRTSPASPGWRRR